MILLYMQKKALEVAAFRVADVDGMVGRKTVALENLDAAASKNRCLEEQLFKKLLINMIGAAAGKQQTVFWHFGHGKAV